MLSIGDSDSGLLRSCTLLGPGIGNAGLTQYSGLLESLRGARDSYQSHHSMCQESFRHGTNGDDEYETIYNDMPAYGLAACDDTVLYW